MLKEIFKKKYCKGVNLMEVTTSKIKSSTRRKFIKPLNDGLKFNINVLKNENIVKHKETKNLLIQTYCTLNNVEYLLNKGNLIDSNSLLRSSFEYILVGMMIQFDDNVFNEFVNLSIDDENLRNHTKIQRLINKFKTHLNDISSTLFKDFNRREKNVMLTDLYDKLSKFTHGSLFVTTFVELNNDEKQILTLINYQNFYFVKILLFCCLKYFTNDSKHYLYEDNMAFVFLLYYAQVASQLNNKNDFIEKYQDLLYIDKNEKYFQKHDKYREKLKKESLILKEEIDNEKFLLELENFLK